MRCVSLISLRDRCLDVFISLKCTSNLSSLWHNSIPFPLQADNFGAAAPRAGNRMQAGLRRRQRGGRGAAADSDDEDGAGGGRHGRRHGGPQAGSEDEGEDPEGEKAATRKDAYEARRAARDAEREAQEAAQEAEIRKAAEERAKREAEEAEKWMHTFTVEAAGEEALSREAGEAQLTKMVEYLQRRKTAALEEVAAEFGLRTAEVVTKVQALEAEGRITGVMDDRGKFIYVSREEMAAVADFIRRRGRVAISEIAAKSADFIDLEGKLAPVEGEDGALVAELLED